MSGTPASVKVPLVLWVTVSKTMGRRRNSPRSRSGKARLYKDEKLNARVFTKPGQKTTFCLASEPISLVGDGEQHTQWLWPRLGPSSLSKTRGHDCDKRFKLKWVNFRMRYMHMFIRCLWATQWKRRVHYHFLAQFSSVFSIATERKRKNIIYRQEP